jgi:predicted nucleic acid-binding protein
VDQRVFLDANVLFSAAYQADAPMYRLWRKGPGSPRLLSSPYAVEEARRNVNDVVQRERLEGLLSAVEFVSDVLTGELPASVVLPDKDRPILLTALAAEATHLVTGDRAHFGAYFGRVIGGVRIESPGDYLRREER